MSAFSLLQHGSYEGNFSLVRLLVKFTTHQAEAAVDEPGIDHVGFTVGAYFFAAPFRPCLPDLAAIHAHLAREAAKLGQVVQRGVGSRVVLREQVHKINVTKVIATDVIVELEVAIVVAKIPVTGSLYAVDQAAVMKHGQIETRPVPADEPRRIALDGLEEAGKQRRLGIVRLAECSHAKTVVVSEDARYGSHLVQVQRHEIVAVRFPPGGQSQLNDLGVAEVLPLRIQGAQPHRIRNGFQIEDQAGGHRAGRYD